jgi:dTDP-4-dehydrorhamnose reductase
MGVYGLNPDGKDFLSQVTRAVSKQKRIRVANDQFGNFTFAGDLAENILNLIGIHACGIWHVAGPEPLLCRFEIAKNICRLGRWDQSLIEGVPTSALDQAAVRPRFGGLDISKILSQGMKMRSLDQVWPK